MSVTFVRTIHTKSPTFCQTIAYKDVIHVYITFQCFSGTTKPIISTLKTVRIVISPYPNAAPLAQNVGYVGPVDRILCQDHKRTIRLVRLKVTRFLFHESDMHTYTTIFAVVRNTRVHHLKLKRLTLYVTKIKSK